ncbi:MAG: DUF1573 domain-containing protein [Crocinitomicaceae bacterium]
MMKNTIILCALFLFGMANVVSAQDVAQGPSISVDKEIHDYGKIKKGDNGVVDFVITNTGNSPLIISKAKGSCSCTVPSYPQEPIAPGKSAVIQVKYDTNKVGAINKSVTITSNAVNEPTKVIRIKGYVEAPSTSGVPQNNSGPASGN